MSQLLTQKSSSEARTPRTALLALPVVIAAIAVPIGIVGAQTSPVVFADDFENGDFNSGWTEVENFVVIPDPTGERPSFVASVIDLSQPSPPTVMFKDDLSLGLGTIARVFFYDDGAQDGDDHEAGLDAGLESISIRIRFDSESLPSSEKYYLFEPATGPTVTTDIPRTVGWHEFRFVITEVGATAFIDGIAVGTVPLLTSANTFFIASEGGEAAYWDDVAIPPILEASSPRGLKEIALWTLASLKTQVNDKGEEKLDEALEFLSESLFGEPGDDELLWLDGFHLNPDQGDDVFGTQNDAVEKLMEILEKPGEYGASDQVIAQIVTTIEDGILEADSRLAQKAIDEAASGEAGLLEEATNEMAEAASAAENSQYDKAVEHYFKAWEAAHKATGVL